MQNEKQTTEESYFNTLANKGWKNLSTQEKREMAMLACGVTLESLEKCVCGFEKLAGRIDTSGQLFKCVCRRDGSYRLP